MAAAAARRYRHAHRHQHRPNRGHPVLQLVAGPRKGVAFRYPLTVIGHRQHQPEAKGPALPLPAVTAWLEGSDAGMWQVWERQDHGLQNGMPYVHDIACGIRGQKHPFWTLRADVSAGHRKEEMADIQHSIRPGRLALEHIDAMCSRPLARCVPLLC
jgi:hypothetical protein